MPQDGLPTEAELDVVRRWNARRVRLNRIGWILLACAFVATVAWAASDETTRDLALGRGETVTVEILGSEQAGACGRGRFMGEDPSFRHSVRVVDPKDSGLVEGYVSAVTMCGTDPVGSRTEVTALPNGSLTTAGAGNTWLAIGLGAGFGVVLAWGLRVDVRRRRTTRALCDGETDWQRVSTPLQSRFGGKHATVKTAQGIRHVQLGIPLSRPDGTLLRWRFVRIPLASEREVELVLPAAPAPGLPVLVEDAEGQRHWRTLSNVRG